MKVVLRIVGGLMVIMVLLSASQYIASERIEVVELLTLDDSGETINTHLWVVDYEGKQYLRAGSDGSGWLTRMKNHPSSIKLIREGNTAAYKMIERPDKAEAINQLMREKYTWGDEYISFLFGVREGSIPLELNPLP
ncbi:MAG: hypothetical protein HOC23_18460 [Halieaceae bacterium]|nr:hypothetical protein [Halieaceae bacterium]